MTTLPPPGSADHTAAAQGDLAGGCGSSQHGRGPSRGGEMWVHGEACHRRSQALGAPGEGPGDLGDGLGCSRGQRGPP